MKAKRFHLVLALLVLAVCPSGCATSHLILEFNGRTIEVQEMKQTILPRGLEVTHFDGRVMRVNGREPISLNGKELTVNGSNVSHGASKHVLGPEHKLVIERSGRLSIVEQNKTNSKASWWGFWR